MAETGEALNFEDYADELGRYFEVQVLRNEGGQIVTIFQDITAQKNLEKRLAELERRPGV